MHEVTAAPVDQPSRERALDPLCNFVVQAPAGSGKTELLTRRFLVLLATVDEPEEVLAITFTRAATAEMRGRVLKSLGEAAEQIAAGSADESSFAVRAVRHGDERGWRLLDQPQRLNIQTIDSLCLGIAHGQPLMARLGGNLSPLEYALSLYAEAAARTFDGLDGGPAELRAALLALLSVRDNNLGECTRLIADMLSRRDQWIRNFPIGGEGSLSTQDWVEIRDRLEAPLRRAIEEVLTRLRAVFEDEEPGLRRELLEVARYACGNSEGDALAPLLELRDLPGTGAEALTQWRCLASFLLTKSNRWRSRLSVRDGFPAGKKGSPEAAWKERMSVLLRTLDTNAELHALLCTVKEGVPPAAYEEEQWQLLRHLFVTLRQAIAELRVIFAERNLVDFIELSLKADDVLNGGDSAGEMPSDQALRLSEQFRHILVDEFQDTSRRQLDLLKMLLRTWEQGEGRTCFLVGDPMQSIYMFRQAEVELFAQVRRHGLRGEEQVIGFENVTLSTNFRSHAGLVEPLNEWFSIIFGAPDPSAPVSFAHSVAYQHADGEARSAHVHPIFIETDAGVAVTAEQKREAQAAETLQIVELVESYGAHQRPDFTLAILGRTRMHLAAVAGELRRRKVPFRAVELESLGELQEILDLKSLTRALLHPADKISWLAVLRAPWCGLTLDDLHALTGADDKAFAKESVAKLLRDRLAHLSEAGGRRALRTLEIVERGMARCSDPTLPFSVILEETWSELGGDACVDAGQGENVQMYFRMIDSLAPETSRCLGPELDEALERLFAKPDPRTSDRSGIQLMTIHKAKGLGFDVVIVPGLERLAAKNDQPLISFMERSVADSGRHGETELLIAPIGQRGDTTSQLTKWVNRQIRARAKEEEKRLLYVACTRARSALHLFGTVVCTANPGMGEEMRMLTQGGLLRTGWPALEAEFRRIREVQLRKRPVPPRQGLLQFPESPQGGLLASIAAMASEEKPGGNLVRRLPEAFFANPAKARGTASVARRTRWVNFRTIDARDDEETFHAARMLRLIGSIAHALLERASKVLARMEAPPAELGAMLEPYAKRLLRQEGVLEVAPALSEVLTIVSKTWSDPVGRWILGRRLAAESESSWTGMVEGSFVTLRADRIFRAGSEALSEGDNTLWIVDYKTTALEGDAESFVKAQRERHEKQLQAYARAMRDEGSAGLAIRLGLYYPLLQRLDSWGA